MNDYQLILRFDTDDPEFVRGFEAGRVWQKLSESDEYFILILHCNNTEMILRMAEAEERTVRCELLDDTWMKVIFE